MPGAMETTRSAIERLTCATEPAGAAGNVAGNAACFIAMSVAVAGAIPAKLGDATVPAAGAAVVAALEDAAAAAFAALVLALCAEIASQAPTTMTNGSRNPAKTAKTFQPKPSDS